MPRATIDQPARPFDVADAIRRAARLRAARQRAGLTVDELARIVDVRARSVNRWESPEGAGSCPDDVLTALGAMLAAQRLAVHDAARAALAGRVGLLYAALRIDPERLSVNPGLSPVNPGLPRFTPGLGPTSKIEPSLAPTRQNSNNPDPDLNLDSMPGGELAGQLDASTTPLDASTRCDAMRRDAIVLPCYYNQAAYDAIHDDGRYFAVENATMRAIAQELERLGFTVDWRYPSTSD